MGSIDYDPYYKNLRKQHIQNKSEVYVIETDDAWEAGNYHYVIAPKDDPSLWLTGYKHECVARKYCNKVGLVTVN